jgi:hypothetical protein
MKEGPYKGKKARFFTPVKTPEKAGIFTGVFFAENTGIR